MGGEEIVWRAWQWLLGLSKVQIAIVGAGLALLVAVSKTLRLVFLIVVVLAALAAGWPRAVQYYREKVVSESLPALFSDAARAYKSSTDQPERPPRSP